MKRKPENPTERLAAVALHYAGPNPRLRRIGAALITIALIVACWVGYRSWKAAGRLQAYERVLAPLPKDDPVYDDNPKTITAVQDRPDYLTVKAGDRLVSHWLPDDPTWPGGLVLLHLAEVEHAGKKQILSVCADVTINSEERVISLYARRTDAPGLLNSWSGRVPSTEVGRLDKWLVLGPADRCTISAADRDLQEDQFVLSYILNGEVLNVIGRYENGRVTFRAEESDSRVDRRNTGQSRGSNHVEPRVMREPVITLRQVEELRDQMGTRLESNLRALSAMLSEPSSSAERVAELLPRCRMTADLIQAYMELSPRIRALKEQDEKLDYLRAE